MKKLLIICLVCLCGCAVSDGDLPRHPSWTITQYSANGEVINTFKSRHRPDYINGSILGFFDDKGNRHYISGTINAVRE
jgi:hypothetical protein